MLKSDHVDARKGTETTQSSRGVTLNAIASSSVLTHPPSRREHITVWPIQLDIIIDKEIVDK